jgi:hypothetical protein
LIAAAIVHHDDLVRNGVRGESAMELLDGGDDAALFVASRYDDRE